MKIFQDPRTGEMLCEVIFGDRTVERKLLYTVDSRTGMQMAEPETFEGERVVHFLCGNCHIIKEPLPYRGPNYESSYNPY